MNYFHLYSSFLKKFYPAPFEGKAPWAPKSIKLAPKRCGVYSPNPDKKLKVVFDCLNSPTSLVLKRLFKKEIQGKRFKLINADFKKSPQFFNPLKKGATSDLRLAIRRHKADLGVIFDFDGDRMFCLDDKGRFIDPDVIARLLIWQLKPKKIIIDVSAGWLVKKLKTENSRLRRGFSGQVKLKTSKVGHYFIKKMMRAENADFGAEHSGHYYFALRSLGEGGLYMDSGILAAIEVINAVSKLPYKLSDFVELLPKYYRSEIDFKLQASSVKRQEFLKKIEAYYKLKAKSYKLLRISHLDGLTMEFEDRIGIASRLRRPKATSSAEGRSIGEGWWFNLRFSQTEPLIRLNIETLEKSKLKETIDKFKKILNRN